MSIVELGYIALEATDVSAWSGFGTDVLGMERVADRSGFACFRLDDRPFRVLVREGDADRLVFAGWEVADQAALDEIAARIEGAGITLRRGSEEEAAARAVGAVISAEDPAGNGLEIYHSPVRGDGTFASPVGVPAFVTDDMGMGHVVLPAPNLTEVFEFYTGVLGFELSDELNVPMGPEGPVLGVKFMHADNPRHHSLALFEGPHPGGCIHWMLEVPDVDTVGHCMDRAAAAEVPLFATLGRHTNDNMLSVYFMSPGGIGVEYGCDGHRMDWEGWEPKVLESGDVWGHIYQMMEG